MYDPMTVAHEIKNPFFKDKHGYRPRLVTIWHVDPEKDGTDDSCGWSFPKITEGEREWLKKVAKDQFNQLFARKVALLEEKSYASVCYNQDTYGVIYWMWRHFNRTINKAVWQYGKPLTNKELNYVYQLATDPVDNFQSHKINTVEELERELFLIYRCWKKFHRKWYQHPRWHIHHWRIQFHPIQNLKRRYWDKCCVCGKRGFKSSAIGSWDGNKIWHQECDQTKTDAYKQNKPL